MPRPLPIFRPRAVARIDGLKAWNRIDTCRIRRRSVELGPDGREVVVWSEPEAPISCRVEPDDRAVREGAVGFRETAREDIIVRLGRDNEVERDDRIEHVESGLVFDVLNSPMAPSVGFEVICHCATTDLPQEEM